MNGSEDQARFYRKLREERRPHDRQRWILLIKELRAMHGCGIYDAERIALQNPIWKRWVEHKINHDLRCAKMARSHVRHNGDAALLVDNDGKLTVR
ncbi:hypothetical protein IP88_11530 [alpha proteobacterium AAP81b]|nr:hypothetical protein IP88_11530 [alpha proteobacterium AAP81b]